MSEFVNQSIKPPVNLSAKMLFPALFLLALLVRLPFLATDVRVSNDVDAYLSWIEAIQTHGLPAVYATSAANYPPILLYAFALARAVTSWLDAGQATLIALIKLPAVLADLGTAGLIAWGLSRHSPAVRTWAFALYAFNPAVWYISAYWGQTDSVYTFFMVAAVLFLSQGMILPAWAAGLLALLTKIQSLPLLPLLFVVTLQRHGWPKLLQGMATAALLATLLTLPWLLTGRIGELLKASTTLPNTEPRLVVSAYNLWFLFRGGYTHLLSANLQPAWLSLSYREISLILFVIANLVVLYLVWRQKGQQLFIAAGLLFLLFFMLPTDVHERYLLPVLPFLLLAAYTKRLQLPFLALYLFISLAFCFNLLTVASPAGLFGGNLIVNIATNRSPGVILLHRLALLVATFYLLVTIGLALFLIGRRKPNEPTTRPSPLDDPALPAG